MTGCGQKIAGRDNESLANAKKRTAKATENEIRS